MDARLAQSSKLIRRATAALGLTLTLFAASSAFALGTPEQRKAGCLSALRRRNSERPRHHRLPAAEQGELERRLPGGVRTGGKLTPLACVEPHALSSQWHRIDMIHACEFVRSKPLSA